MSLTVYARVHTYIFFYRRFTLLTYCIFFNLTIHPNQSSHNVCCKYEQLVGVAVVAVVVVVAAAVALGSLLVVVVVAVAAVVVV